MRYPKPTDRYSCEVLCENFMEVDERLKELEENGGGGTGGSVADVTAENIVSALGYTPADENDVNELSFKVDELANAGGGNLVGVELTQAEYDALSDEEKNNGLYFITDGVYNEDANDTGWVALTDRISYRAKNGFCTITGFSLGHVALSSGSWATMTTLPSDITPSIEVRFCLNSSGAVNTSAVSMVGSIKTTGELQIYCKGLSAEESKYWAFTVTYPID